MIYGHSKLGFSLVEISLAIVVIAVGLSIVVVMFPAGLKQNAIAAHETQAALFAEEVFNTVHAVGSSKPWSTFLVQMAGGIPIASPPATATVYLDNNLYTNKFTSQDGSITHFTFRYRINANYTTTIPTTTLCAIVNENSTLTLTAPAGALITSIKFASFGTPSGNCTDGYSIGSCHAASSFSTVQALAALPKPSISIPANNATFGDPCGGTAKKLAVEATAAFFPGVISDNVVPVTIEVWPDEWGSTNAVDPLTFYTEVYDSGL